MHNITKYLVWHCATYNFFIDAILKNNDLCLRIFYSAMYFSSFIRKCFQNCWSVIKQKKIYSPKLEQSTIKIECFESVVFLYYYETVKFFSFCDDKEITSTSDSDRISIIRTRADKGCYELVIRDVTPADAGHYSCKAMNIYGDVTTEATVTVVSKYSN